MDNKTIGKYRILRLIGEGGMASVYEAVHELLGTRVAIKVLNPILSANAQISERFKNEARVMASLNHPGITRVIDFDESPQQFSIVMEYLEGEDLNQWVRREGALSEMQVREVFPQILSAFQYAHEMGIVHRDIKPSNIFIGPNRRVKVLDFGIAKLFGQGNESTQTGTQMGTPVYMSPEQVKSDKSIDFRSDIYSLGVTLYFMTNGKPPYDTTLNSQFDIFTKIVFEPLPQLQADNPFRSSIERACEKDRERRFQSCTEWLQALDEKQPPRPAATGSDVAATAAGAPGVFDSANKVSERRMEAAPEAKQEAAEMDADNELVFEAPQRRKGNRVLFAVLAGLLATIGLVFYFSRGVKSEVATADTARADQPRDLSDLTVKNKGQNESEKKEQNTPQKKETLKETGNTDKETAEAVEAAAAAAAAAAAGEAAIAAAEAHKADAPVAVTIPVQEEDEDKVFVTAEREAEFPGGMEQWKRHLQTNLNPQVPVNNGAPGGRYTAVVRFIVYKDGSIRDISCQKDPGYGMCQEAIRVIKRGPKWIPGQHKGKTVNSYHLQPVSFVITDE